MSINQIKICKPQMILCDIEGTTTSIDFVKKILFPFFIKNLEEFLQNKQNDPLIQNCLNNLIEQFANFEKNPQEKFNDFERLKIFKKFDDIVHFIQWLVEKDYKLTSLKQLQQFVWTKGYDVGVLKGHVYEDVPRCFQRWRSMGIKIGIYSSGSIEAQKLLFSTTQFGDLNSFIQYNFDTNIGSKMDPQSYYKIAEKVNLSPSEILFLTDIIQEAEAAHKTMMNVFVVERDTNLNQSNGFKTIESFEDINFHR
ncbi:Enolase-phosphatase E1 [Sarcoptes scabiei]|uniref:Enolase-phosphatase E1 n=2 Tax=Sarcoptes scabiei TaxID=52283 RepID=A0A834R5L5_SARSC|nr:Enolase-phosphatase E1 [Sarcoptes scabiei]